MGKPKRIKGQTAKQGGLVKSQEPVNHDDNFLIFSLEKLQFEKYCLSSLNQENKAKFADAIYRKD